MKNIEEYPKANLYKKWTKEGDPICVVRVLHIGTVSDSEGSGICASVMLDTGDVIEVSHDRLQFILGDNS